MVIPDPAIKDGFFPSSSLPVGEIGKKQGQVAGKPFAAACWMKHTNRKGEIGYQRQYEDLV